jgi:hypothetical protein
MNDDWDGVDWANFFHGPDDYDIERMQEEAYQADHPTIEEDSFDDYDSNDDPIFDSADEVAHNTATGQTDRVVVPPLDELSRLRHPLTEGEALVLDFFLRNLPKSWEIYIQPHLNGLEPDFILLHPKRGIAVYEVRDWTLESPDIFVTQPPGGSPTLMKQQDGASVLFEKDNPVTQVDLCKNEIYSLYCPQLPSRSGLGVITAGVILPFATFDHLEALLKPFRDQYDHSSKQSLYPLVGSEILNSTDKWSFRARVLPSVQREDDRINEDRAADLRRWLIEPRAEGSTQRTLFDDLNPRQKKLVTTRTTSGYRRIKGCAGSGKSFVLAGRAAWLASGKDDETQARKKKVLIITYNITLINYLLDLAVQFNPGGKVRDQITALNFHYWCKRVARESGHYSDYLSLWRAARLGDGTPAERTLVLKTTMAKAAMTWLDDVDLAEKFDAILLDEGQDFELIWWRAMRRALRPGGEAVLCGDWVQNIYGVSAWPSDDMADAGFKGPWMVLPDSYRLSPLACDLATDFIDTFLPDLDFQRPVAAAADLFETPILKWWHVDNASIARGCVAALMDIITNSSPQVSHSDLTCIVESESIGNEVVRLLQEEGLTCIHTFGVGNSKIERHYDSQRRKIAFSKGIPFIKITTIQSFKGWESRALVVHAGSRTSPSALALVYVAITRLKRDVNGSYLTVVSASPHLLSYGETWPVFKNSTTATDSTNSGRG